MWRQSLTSPLSTERCYPWALKPQGIVSGVIQKIINWRCTRYWKSLSRQKRFENLLSGIFKRHRIKQFWASGLPVVRVRLFQNPFLQYPILSVSFLTVSFLISILSYQYPLRVSFSFQYHNEDSSLGVEYFQNNMFGYTVYGLLGLFIISLVVGLIWQHFPQAKKEQKFPTQTGNYITLIMS